MQSTKTKIDPRLLKPYRSRREPTDPAELAARNERRKALALSWLENPINEVYVRDGDYAIGEGNERVAGCVLLGRTEITISLLPPGTTDAELDDLSLLTDFHKTALTPFEKATVAKRRIDSSGIKQGDLSKKLNVSEGYLAKLLALFECPPEVIAAAEAGRIGPEEWPYCRPSKSPNPLETLRVKLSGGSREEVRNSTRQPAGKPDADTELTERLAIAMSAGSVNVTSKQRIKKGEARPEPALNLAAAKVLLEAALAKVEWAIQMNYSIKTAQRAFEESKGNPVKVRKQRKPKEIA